MHLKKPSWLKAKTWGEFCSKYQREDGSFPCSHPGCLRHADTVDHIKPRSHPDFTELREYIDEDDRKRRRQERIRERCPANARQLNANCQGAL